MPSSRSTPRSNSYVSKSSNNSSRRSSRSSTPGGKAPEATAAVISSEENAKAAAYGEKTALVKEPSRAQTPTNVLGNEERGGAQSNTAAANIPSSKASSRSSSRASTRPESSTEQTPNAERKVLSKPQSPKENNLSLNDEVGAVADATPPTSQARGGADAVSVAEKLSRQSSSVQESSKISVSVEQAPLNMDERAQWKVLDAENKKLILKLAELNTALDKQLSKQGINLPSRPGGAAAAAGIIPGDALNPNTEVNRLKQRADTLRKSNSEIQKALKEHASIKGSAFDLRNRHTVLVKELEHLRSDNQSLENVYINQTSKTSQDEKAQNELKRMRSDHNDVQRESREAARQLKELRESEMSNLRILLKQQDLINEKLRFLADEQQSSPSSSPAGDVPNIPSTGKYALPHGTKKPYDVSELQMILSNLTTEEADTLKDINNLTGKTNKARWKLVAEKKSTELEDLKDELKLLKEHADAKRIYYPR